MQPNVMALAKYRLEKSKEDLVTSKTNYDAGLYRGSVNRSYYAIFHAVRALLALEQKDYKKHSSVIAHFHKEYVKTGLFDKKYGEVINRAFEIRNEADYEDFYVFSKESVKRQLENAIKFIDAVEDYIGQQSK